MVFGYRFKGVSGQLVINEIDASAATPLPAVKLLAIYLSGLDFKVPYLILNFDPISQIVESNQIELDGMCDELKGLDLCRNR